MSKMNKYKIEDRMSGFSGRQKVYKFPNNFGASVINGAMLHSFKFYSEIAVFDFNKKGGNRLSYETDITNDVEVAMSKKEETIILKYIKKLDKSGKLTKRQFQKYMDLRYPR